MHYHRFKLHIKKNPQATLTKIVVLRQDEYIRADWEVFPSVFRYYFLTKKRKKEKKKDFAAARLATISATHWTGNKLFFKGGPRKAVTGRNM